MAKRAAKKRGELTEWILKWLNQYGYLSTADMKSVQSLEDIQVTSAIAAYQRFDANVGELKSLTGEPLIDDGKLGPATQLAMQMPRCACPDPITEAAVGTGGWQGCHGSGDSHKAVVEVNQSNLPAFLRPHFTQVLKNTQQAYAEIGLLFIFRDSTTKEDMLVGGSVSGRTNTDFSFTVGNGWIGLAIVGTGPRGNQACSQTIWCRYDKRYQPGNVEREWTTLVKHELGHNSSLRHTSGGVMNPSIVRGLPTGWAANDPSTPTLKRLYAGVPVDVPGGEPNPPDPEPPGDDWPAPGNPVSPVFRLANGENVRVYSEFG